jgi:hypothetical protein
VTGVQELLNEVATSKWQPTFKYIDPKAILLVADAINQPHEDYPHLVDATVETIKFYIQIMQRTEDDTDSGWTPELGDALAIQKLLWGAKQNKMGSQAGHIDIGLRKCNVTVGEFVPPHPIHVRELIEGVFQRFNALDLSEMSTRDILDAATNFYKEFETVHPFEDLNGRVGGILLNLITYYYTGSLVISTKYDNNIDVNNNVDTGNTA